MYYIFHVIGFLGAAAYILIMAPKYGFNRIRTVVFTALTYISVYALMLLLFYFVNGRFGGQNIVRVFAFVPPIAALFAAALGMNVRRALELAAPIPCIVHGISHFGCLFTGCCRSWLHIDWGIYNRIVGAKLFPIQICEAITALIIAGMIIVIAKRNNYDCHGKTMPLMLLLFGITRFGWEFLRDNTKLFLNISDLALWAATSALIGAIWLIIEALLNSKNIIKDAKANSDKLLS